jgi:hypothetical protein
MKREQLLQPRILGFGFLEDGDVGVGIVRETSEGIDEPL